MKNNSEEFSSDKLYYFIEQDYCNLESIDNFLNLYSRFNKLNFYNFRLILNKIVNILITAHDSKFLHLELKEENILV